MLRGSWQLKRVAQLICISLLVLAGSPGCDKIGLGSKGNDTDFQKYGIYRIVAFEVCIQKQEKGKSRRGRRYKPPKAELYDKMGTGFLVDDKNLIVTNNHVIDLCGGPARIIKIVSISKDKDGKDKLELVDADLVTNISGNSTSAVKEDLALLRPKKLLPGVPLPFADYEPYTGSEVRAVGYPGAADDSLKNKISADLSEAIRNHKFDNPSDQDEKNRFIFNEYLNQFKDKFNKNPAEFSPSYTQGVVSRTYPVENVPVVIQHQAPISPGNSGGPLLDACGSAIGINTAVAVGEGVQGISMSLGSQWLAGQIKASGSDVRLKPRCLAASQTRTMTYLIGGIAALLSIATLLFAFRRTPAGQTVFGRSGAEQTPMPSSERGATMPASSGPGRYAGDGSTVRLIPTGAGQPIALPVERLSSSGGCIIGRESGNDARIDEKTVSKRHARLILDDSGRLFIEDLGSANGTWKKGAKITRDVFASGDTVRFGAAEFRIELPVNGGATQRFDGSSSAGKTEKVGGGAAAAGSGAVYAWLERLDASGQRIAVKATSVRIGRHEDNDLRFEEPSVHRRHAVLHITPQREFVITDLSGEGGNGVKVNSKRVEKAELHDGDVVEIGTVRLKFHVASV